MADTPGLNKDTDAATNDAPASDTDTRTQANQQLTNVIDKVSETRKVYSDFDDDTNFNTTFRKAVQDGLARIRRVLRELETKVVEQSTQTPSPSFETFSAIMASLKAILDQISKTKVDKRFQFYKDYVRGRRENLVETLVSKMMDEVGQIVKGHGAEKELEEELVELQAEIQKLKHMPPSAPIEQNGGSQGDQYNVYGGRQYNAKGGAKQFNDTVFHGGQTFN
ncbi:hypothetical protein HDV63DRAFT_95704 [Trichoderma sp. SZMC 28014]